MLFFQFWRCWIWWRRWGTTGWSGTTRGTDQSDAFLGQQYVHHQDQCFDATFPQLWYCWAPVMFAKDTCMRSQRLGFDTSTTPSHMKGMYLTYQSVLQETFLSTCQYKFSMDHWPNKGVYWQAEGRHAPLPPHSTQLSPQVFFCQFYRRHYHNLSLVNRSSRHAMQNTRNDAVDGMLPHNVHYPLWRGWPIDLS